MQQTLATSFKCHTIRRRTRIGSHNLEWLSVDGEDLVDLLVESVMKNSDWYMLFTFRKISRAFRSMVNAKLDKLLAEFRALADASRLEVTQLADTHPMPDGWWDIRDWIKGTDAIRLSKPTHFKAYAAYKNLLDNWFSPAIADRLAKFNHTTGFWLHRDELLAWHLEVCVKCHGAHHTLGIVNTSEITGRTWMTPCHSSGTRCCPVVHLSNVNRCRTYASRVAGAILRTRPYTRELSELLQSLKGDDYVPGQSIPNYAFGNYVWAMPITGIPAELTLLGASGMDMCEVDRLVVTETAKKAQAAKDREEKRTSRRDDEVARLEAMAEAHLSAHAPSIKTLKRFNALEDRHKWLSASIPRRPLPSHRILPLHHVWYKQRRRVFLFHLDILLKTAARDEMLRSYGVAV